MPFKLDVTLTEEDYLAFNIFHSLESANSKKTIRNSRIVFICTIAAIIAAVLLITGWTAFTTLYVIVLGLFTVIYMLLYKKLLIRSVRSQLKRLKKGGKLPFDPVSRLEFHEDKLIEICPSQHSEQSYHTLERICIVKDRYIYLYKNSIGAFILPIPQIKNQLNEEEFLRFLLQKCDTVEHYE